VLNLLRRLHRWREEGEVGSCPRRLIWRSTGPAPARN